MTLPYLKHKNIAALGTATFLFTVSVCCKVRIPDSNQRTNPQTQEQAQSEPTNKGGEPQSGQQGTQNANSIGMPPFGADDPIENIPEAGDDPLDVTGVFLVYNTGDHYLARMEASDRSLIEHGPDYYTGYDSENRQGENRLTPHGVAITFPNIALQAQSALNSVPGANGTVGTSGNNGTGAALKLVQQVNQTRVASHFIAKDGQRVDVVNVKPAESLSSVVENMNGTLSQEELSRIPDDRRILDRKINQQPNPNVNTTRQRRSR